MNQEVQVLAFEEIGDADEQIRGEVATSQTGCLNHEAQIGSLTQRSDGLKVDCIQRRRNDQHVVSNTGHFIREMKSVGWFHCGYLGDKVWKQLGHDKVKQGKVQHCHDRAIS